MKIKFTRTLSTAALLFGLVALAACTSSAEDAPAAAAKAELPASSEQDLKSALDGVVGAGVAPGAALTVDHPSYRAWSTATGVADVTTNAALTTTARFRAGSMLKPSIAIAVLQLVESGRLSLDATLPALLPADVAARIPHANAITLRMLLGHRSGVADFDDDAFDAMVAATPTRVWSFDFILDRAVAMGPKFAPGTSYSYTNTGYVLLGRILEQATGQPWRTTIRDRVFARARMDHSELPEEGNARCAACSRGYLPMEDRLVDVTEIDPSMAGPAGGDALISTPEDLAKLLRALTDGRLFDDPKTLDLMLDFADAPTPEEAQVGYGLGLARFDVHGVEMIGHLGGTAGFHGFVLLQRNTGVIASGYINKNGDAGAFYVPVLEAVSRIR